MAIIGMRELLRDSTDVFKKVEEESEPFLITRRGKPIATLTPVSPADVERLVLTAAPEFVERRRASENSRAEGRTRSLDQVAEDFGVEPDDSDRVHELSQGLLERLGVEPDVRETEAAALDDVAALRRVQTLNARLLGVFAAAARQRLIAESEAVPPAARPNSDELEHAAVELAASELHGLNNEIVDIGQDLGRDNVSFYEASIIGGLDVAERLAGIGGERSEDEPAAEERAPEAEASA